MKRRDFTNVAVWHIDAIMLTHLAKRLVGPQISYWNTEFIPPATESIPDSNTHTHTYFYRK